MNPRILFIILATILLPLIGAPWVGASDLQIAPPTQQVSGASPSTVTGSFVVTAIANASNIKVESTTSNISFTPNTFSLTQGANQTVNFAIAVAPQTAPGQSPIPFTVNATHPVSGSITLTVASSPALTLTNLDLSKTNRNGTITIKNTGNIDLSNIALSLNADALKDRGNRQITLTVADGALLLIENNIPKNNLALLKAGESKTLSVASTFPTRLNLGDYTTTLTASTPSINATSQITIENSFCRFGRIGGDIDIQRVKDISSDDEWEWRPLDEVQVEVKVRNNGDDDEDIEINWELYDPENQEFVDLDDNEKTLSIDEDSTETETITIKVPEDVEDKDYRLYVKAFIEGDEDLQCTDLLGSDEFQRVDIEKKSRDVVLSDINIPPAVSCGSSFDITAKVTNIGRNDEDKVKVSMINQELKINVESLGVSLDEGDSRTIQLTAKIPQDAAPKAYDLNLLSYFQFDDDDNTYEKRSDPYKREIKVENCQQPLADTKKSVTLAAELLSEVKAGKQIGIRVSLKNTGDAQTTYTLGVSDIDEWATLDRIEPQAATLEKGESKDILIYLNAKPEASGKKEFIIKAVYAGKVTEQKVALTVEPSTQIDTSKIAESFRENWFIWLIVLVNIVLIILIIIAARRLAR